MAKSGNKIVARPGDAEAFIASVEDERRRGDSERLLAFMKRVTGEPPVMWGPSMIGFGQYHYKYESGREGDYFITGFSPRKANLTIYLMAGFGPYEDELSRLGKHKLGKSCLYVKKLDDIDETVLATMVKENISRIKRIYDT